MNDLWSTSGLSLAVLAPVMALAWLRQRRTRNAGIVDVIWSASLGVLAVVYAATGDGWEPRRWLVAVLAGLWSARLTAHLARRVASEPEDGRYAILRETWGDRFQSTLFWFYQAQAVLAVALAAALFAVANAEAPGWRPQDLVAVLLWVVSLAGETVADRQLHDWRGRPENRGRTCRSGLWAWSRHPNYFFEWLHWLVYPVLGLGLEGGWLLWLAPASMLLLILKVTGIPSTEEQSVRSRGDDYRDYQATTNAFFPGPRRERPRELTETS